MKTLKVATAQFETHSGDKDYNLSRIAALVEQAKEENAEIISFHELCVTGYTFLKDLHPRALFDLAEEIPDGPSVQRLIQMARESNLHILAGLVEKDKDKVYNSYVCVNGEGLVSKFRKLHPFIHPHICPGNEFVQFEIKGWKCSILICYDNNVIENVRAVALQGAQILFAPHVTMCTPSPAPGRGFVSTQLWENRLDAPEKLRSEFDGPKGAQWLMTWLPARAYDNGIFVVFSNPIGMEGDQVKNGNSLILDPYGQVLSEIKSFYDTMTFALCDPEKLSLAGGYRYREARRPELYGPIIARDHISSTKPVWLKDKKPGNNH